MQAVSHYNINDITSNLKPAAKILFATFPGDGHVNPLTGLAVYLKNIGHDVRWYTGSQYAEKIKKLGIPYFPFKRALEVRADQIDEIFPDRKLAKSQIAKLKYDIINVFIKRSTEYYDDIREIDETFPFDIMIADVAFTGIPLVKDHMKKPVISIGIIPLPENSKDLPPSGMGMTPSNSIFGKVKQAFLRYFSNTVLFKEPNRVLKEVLDTYGVEMDGSLFDTNVRKADLYLQSGTPTFEYYRSDMSKNVRFVGPLLPYSKKRTEKWFNEKLMDYDKVVLVTQGTVERDTTKIIIPALEAFKDSNVLVIATTGGSDTESLKAKYNQENIIVEDFIPFDDVMPYADAYVTNGGYGGVMLGIQNKLPLVVAGVHEGKNEINARIGYFGLGVNLRTERPTAQQVKDAVLTVFMNDQYKINVQKLGKEFDDYNANELCAQYVDEVLNKSSIRKQKAIFI